MQKLIGILFLVLGITLLSSCGASLYTINVQVLTPAKSKVHLGQEQGLTIAMLYGAEPDSDGRDSLLTMELLMELQRLLVEAPTLKNTPVNLRPLPLSDDTLADRAIRQQLQDNRETLLVISRLNGNVAQQGYSGADYGLMMYSVYCYLIARGQHMQEACDSTVVLAPRATRYTDVVAAQIAQDVAPYWVWTTRAIYVDNSGIMQEAGRLAQSFRWSEAMQLWSTEVNTKNATRSAQAAYNMAIGCEMMDQYDLAKEWITYSRSRENSPMAKYYERMLHQRIEQNRRITGAK
ncbi:MAG: DUF6340 family protein [Prevotellaceae bacterium]|jgi:hypothetical protein|nr:DUF6340 family protein [Prevotellaceae bacterium]